MTNRLLFIFIMLYASASLAAQQPYFLSSPPTAKGKATTKGATVLTADQFSKQVTQDSAQQQAAFQQKLNQKMAQMPPPPRLQAAPNPTAPNATAAAPTQQATPPASNYATPAYVQQPAPTPNPNTVQPTNSTTLPAPPPTPYSPPQPAQQQVYTGFSAPPPPSNTAVSPQKNTGGGWNIKY